MEVEMTFFLNISNLTTNTTNKKERDLNADVAMDAETNVDAHATADFTLPYITKF